MKRKRRYPTQFKTTTKQGKREYMRQYMRDYRRQQKQQLELLKKQFPNVYKMIFGSGKRKRK